MVRKALLSITLNLIGAATVFSYTTYYVAPKGANSLPCDRSSPCDLEFALEQARTDGTDSELILLPGEYEIVNQLEYIVDDGDGRLIIQAENMSKKPILRMDGRGSGAILYIENDSHPWNDDGANITIRGLVFEKGKAGGLKIITGNALVSVNHCEFYDNSGEDGGGLRVGSVNGDLSISNNRFIGNEASSSGGGLYLITDGRIKVSYNIFTKNYSGSNGGGAYIYKYTNSDSYKGTMIFLGNSFEMNKSGEGGGAYIVCDGQRCEIEKNLFIKNELIDTSATSRIGGGLDLSTQGITYVRSNIFKSNSGADRGGGIYIRARHTSTPLEDLYLVNNTIYMNSSGGAYILIENYNLMVYNNIIRDNGQDLYVLGYGNEGVYLYSNIFSDNTEFGDPSDHPNNSFLSVNNVLNYNQFNNLTSDPQFVNPALDDLHILPSSPAVDSGFSSTARPSSDFEYDSIPQGSAPDIGADEYDPSNLYTLTVSVSGNGTVTSTPEGISCESDCEEDYGNNWLITLTASPSSGYTFERWEGDCSGCSDRQCNIKMTADRSCTAVFSAIPVPDINVTPAGIDFGDVMVGDSSERIVMISNNGDADLTVNSIDLTGSAADFTLNTDADPYPCGSLPAVISPGASCTVSVGFTPMSAGSRSTDLQISSNDPDEGTVTVPLSGNGVVDSPPTITSFTVDPASGNAPLSVTFTCNATDDVGIAEYRFDFGDGSPESSGTSPSVDHTYTDPGTYTARCTVTDTSGQTAESTVSVEVFDPSGGGGGAGGSGDIYVTPADIDFGDVMVGDSSERIVTISNRGTADLTITGFYIRGTDVGHFGLYNNKGSSPCGSLPVALSPGSFCTIGVEFFPSSSGSKSVDLQIDSNDPDEPSVIIPLSGNGTVDNPPTISSFTADPRTGTAPLTVVFTCDAADDMGIAEYRFDFGDGSPESVGTSPTANHTYTSAGTFTARCTVTDTSGRSAEATIDIEVNDPSDGGGGDTGGGDSDSGGAASGGGGGGGCASSGASQGALLWLLPLALFLRRLLRG